MYCECLCFMGIPQSAVGNRFTVIAVFPDPIGVLFALKIFNM